MADKIVLRATRPDLPDGPGRDYRDERGRRWLKSAFCIYACGQCGATSDRSAWYKMASTFDYGHVERCSDCVTVEG